ncbi:uncharacterized protein LOC109862638 isoform X1 [Pseudomyrmex gracilis]|uniref:uncharacterized protein LOC109862638 isoform X1 n=1 Tax=Pseudomyrmex gracilis TaxID=219809 RepID=UPI000994FD1A|nr:uncharacterized protein LOC109862638 isoform X1 [Pseudomyrmex gracilis]XP_020298317.1 uncharacterized protein LOC109862638 isoform X1 [Pseudomyrmex gracilis]
MLMIYLPVVNLFYEVSLEAREEQAVNEKNIEEEFTFPLENEDQLVEFETKLKNPIFFQKMISSLKIIGESKVNLANAILSKLIADTLATKYSWYGKKGKKAFMELLTSKLIIKTVHMIQTQCTDTQITEAASIWLAQAPTRLKRVEAKKQQRELFENRILEQYKNNTIN